MRFARQGLAVALAALFVLAGIARADVFQQVPSDAVMVIRFNNLQQTSQRLGKLAKDLGLAAMVPQAADPLAFAKEQLKLTNGINDAGDAAVVIINPATAEDADKPVYLLIPVSDFDAFLRNFPNPEQDGDAWKVPFGESGEDAFVTRMGGYAGIAPVKSNLGKPDGLRLTPVARKESDSKDVTVIANFGSIREQGMPALNGLRGEALAEVLREIKNDEKHAKFAPALESLVNQAFNIAETFLRDTDIAVVGLGFAGDGIAVGVVSEFQPDSYLGKFASSLKNTDAPLLVGLPAGKYLLYGGALGDPAAVLKVIDDFSAPVVAELAKLGDDGKSIVSFFDQVKALVGEVKGQSFGMFTPTIQLGETPLVQLVYHCDGNGEKINAIYRDMVNAQNALMSGFGVQPAGITTTITENAKTVNDVSFTRFATTIAENAADPEAAQAAQMMKIFYGPEGATAYTAVVGGKFLSVMGLNDEQIGQAIAAIKAGSSPLSGSPNLKQVASQLPKNRQVEVYVHLDEVVSTALTAAAQFGMGVNVQLPPDLPPIGATLATEGSAIRVDAFVPTPLVQSLVAAGMQIFMQMQGGGQPGGPGGL